MPTEIITKHFHSRNFIFYNSIYILSTIYNAEHDVVCRKQEQLLLSSILASIYSGFSEGTDHRSGEYLILKIHLPVTFILPLKLFGPLPGF